MGQFNRYAQAKNPILSVSCELRTLHVQRNICNTNSQFRYFVLYSIRISYASYLHLDFFFYSLCYFCGLQSLVFYLLVMMEMSLFTFFGNKWGLERKKMIKGYVPSGIILGVWFYLLVSFSTANIFSSIFLHR